MSARSAKHWSIWTVKLVLRATTEHKNEASHWQAGAITIIGDSRAKKSVGPTNRASGQNTLEHMERHLRGPVA